MEDRKRIATEKRIKKMVALDKFQFSILSTSSKGMGIISKASRKDKVWFEDTYRWKGDAGKNLLARCGWSNGLEHPLLFSWSETTIRIRRSGLLPLSFVLCRSFGPSFARAHVIFSQTRTYVFPFNSYSLSYFDVRRLARMQTW